MIIRELTGFGATVSKIKNLLFTLNSSELRPFMGYSGELKKVTDESPISNWWDDEKDTLSHSKLKLIIYRGKHGGWIIGYRLGGDVITVSADGPATLVINLGALVEAADFS